MRKVLPFAGLFGLALTIRLLHLDAIADLHFYSHPFIDAQEYERAARELATGVPQETPGMAHRALGFAWFLSAVYAVFGVDVGHAHVAQAVVGASIPPAAAAVGLALLPRPAAWVAGVVLAFYGPAILFEGDLLREPLLTLLFLLMALGWSRHRLTGSRGGLLLAGMALAGAVLVRENMLVFAPAGAVLLRADRKGLALFLVPLVLAGLALGAWNHRTEGRFVVVSPQGAFNFYLGNHPDMDRLTSLQPGATYDSLLSEPLRKEGIWNSGEQSAWFWARAFDRAREEPLAWLRVTAKKIWLFFAGYEFAPNQDIESLRDASRVLRWTWGQVLGLYLPFGLVAPLALVGALLAWRSGRAFERELVGAVFLFAATIIAFHVRARYRLPAVPLMVLLAAVPLVRRDHWGLRGGLALVVLGVALNAPWVDWSYAERFPSNYYLGKHHYRQGDLVRASRYYKRAVKDGRNPVEAHHDLGVVLRVQDDLHGARKQFEAAIVQEPQHEMLRENLSDLLHQMGDRRGAVRQIDRAIAVHGYLPRLHLKRARLLERGRPREAARSYGRVIELGRTLPTTSPAVLEEAREALDRLKATDPPRS